MELEKNPGVELGYYWDLREGIMEMGSRKDHGTGENPYVGSGKKLESILPGS